MSQEPKMVVTTTANGARVVDVTRLLELPAVKEMYARFEKAWKAMTARRRVPARRGRREGWVCLQESRFYPEYPGSAWLAPRHDHFRVREVLPRVVPRGKKGRKK